MRLNAVLLTGLTNFMEPAYLFGNTATLDSHLKRISLPLRNEGTMVSQNYFLSKCSAWFKMADFKILCQIYATLDNSVILKKYRYVDSTLILCQRGHRTIEHFGDNEKSQYTPMVEKALFVIDVYLFSVLSLYRNVYQWIFNFGIPLGSDDTTLMYNSCYIIESISYTKFHISDLNVIIGKCLMDDGLFVLKSSTNYFCQNVITVVDRYKVEWSC